MGEGDDEKALIFRGGRGQRKGGKPPKKEEVSPTDFCDDVMTHLPVVVVVVVGKRLLSPRAACCLASGRGSICARADVSS